VISKCFEVRDRSTFIPVMAVRMTAANEAQRYLLRRAGFGVEPAEVMTMLTHLVRSVSQNSPHDWGDRTMAVAHQWIHDHFAELADGAVVDVEFILGESAAPKQSEREAFAS